MSQMPLRPIKHFNITFGVFGLKCVPKRGQKNQIGQNFASPIFMHFCRQALKCARDNFNCIILLIEFRKAIWKGTLNGVRIKV